MQCPNCQTEVSRGTAICPSCDEILDASVFESPSGGNSFEEKTGIADADELKGMAVRPLPSPPPPKATNVPPQATKSPALGGDPRKPASDPRKSSPARPPAAEAAPKGGKGHRRRWTRPTTSADEVLTDGWAAFRNLPVFEQCTIVALLIGAIALLFPWRMNDNGSEDIGIFAAPLALLPLLLAIGAATLRMGNDLRGFRADQLATVQLICGVLLLGLCAYFCYQTLDIQIRHGMLRDLRQSSTYPEVGCIACGLAAMGIAASGAWAYLEEHGYE